MTADFGTINKAIQDFSENREWDQFHNPSNLVLALMSEVGELAELIQWKSTAEVNEYLQTHEGQERFSEEVADVAIYLIRICQKSGLDLMKIIENKLRVNELKYPVDKSRGNSSKYTEF
jgi:dCTP diphosphatase